jgi:hypothetical protein
MHHLGGSTNANIFEEATAINFWGDVGGVESVLEMLAPTGVHYSDGVAAPMARFLVQPPAGWSPPTNVADINDSPDVVGSVFSNGLSTAAVHELRGFLWTKINGCPDSSSRPFLLL